MSRRDQRLLAGERLGREMGGERDCLRWGSWRVCCDYGKWRMVSSDGAMASALAFWVGFVSRNLGAKAVAEGGGRRRRGVQRNQLVWAGDCSANFVGRGG
ncbi:hypothetical protein EJ06DRAFT_353206 [Trichodelitschia bisporula]|uniref:Uncharacterized protein n=1 Tax=Trichodelitschia bisporula TaxID=703511 RepID=A0A6G1I0N0_9PEZI|nr:hypothetical protein EJ06DRAFT_353206 [Trichodelitschia bisporula]